MSCLGHSDPDVTAAIKGQVDQIAFAHTGFFTSVPAEQLADLLIDHAPGNLDRVYFVSGGSEAMEAALKLARQYFLEKRRNIQTPGYSPPAKLSRQHARGAGDRWQSVAP